MNVIPDAPKARSGIHTAAFTASKLDPGSFPGSRPGLAGMTVE
jgi:hypothetical protein